MPRHDRRPDSAPRQADSTATRPCLRGITAEPAARRCTGHRIFAPRLLLAVVLVLAVAGTSCSPPGGSEPAARPGAGEPSPVEGAAATTTTEPSLVFQAPQQQPQALPEPFESAELLEQVVIESFEQLEDTAASGTEPDGRTAAGDVDPPAASGQVEPAAASGQVEPAAEGLAEVGRPDQRAADPATPPAELAALAGVNADTAVAVRRAVAVNPATPPDVLRTLAAGDPDPGVRWLAASNPSMWPETRVFPELQVPDDEEQDDDEPDLRLAVADNPGPWPDVLATLTADVAARQWAAANPHTAPGALLALAGDIVPDVAVWVAANPNAPPAALAHIVESSIDPAACRAAAENRATPPYLLARIAGEARAGRFLDDPVGCEAAGALLGVARNPRTWPETLARLAADTDDNVRAVVAGNPATPPETLEPLATDSEILVRLAVAANPSTPPDALDRLVADDDPGVAWQAATNPATSRRTLDRLAEDPTFVGRRVVPDDPLPEPPPPPPEEEPQAGAEPTPAGQEASPPPDESNSPEADESPPADENALPADETTSP